jgi:hypothetical protein
MPRGWNRADPLQTIKGTPGVRAGGGGPWPQAGWATPVPLSATTGQHRRRWAGCRRRQLRRGEATTHAARTREAGLLVGRRPKPRIRGRGRAQDLRTGRARVSRRADGHVGGPAAGGRPAMASEGRCMSLRAAATSWADRSGPATTPRSRPGQPRADAILPRRPRHRGLTEKEAFATRTWQRRAASGLRRERRSGPTRTRASNPLIWTSVTKLRSGPKRTRASNPSIWTSVMKLRSGPTRIRASNPSNWISVVKLWSGPRRIRASKLLIRTSVVKLLGTAGQHVVPAD